MTAAKAKQANIPVEESVSAQPKAKGVVGEPKITDAVREFVHRKLAQFATYHAIIEALPESGVVGAKGKPITLALATISRLAHEEGARAKIDEYRQEYLTEFNDTPLAFTKIRVRELTRIFHETLDARRKLEKLADATAAEKRVIVGLDNRILTNTEMQLQILGQLREETEPLNATLTRNPSAQEALEYLHSVGFGQSDSRPVQPDARPKDGH